MNEIDETDKEIARLLATGARKNSEVLAKALKLSSATIRRRLRNLLSKDYLRIVGVVDSIKFGFPLAVVIALDVTHSHLESALEELAKKPEVRWIATTTGRFDIIAFARFSSNDSLAEFMSKDLSKLRGIRDCETFIGLHVKKGQYVTLH